MKKWSLLIIFSAFVMLAGCSLQNLDQTQGVVWEYEMDYDVTAGIATIGNAVFFADEKGTVYNVWMDTGNARWIRTLSNENVVLLYTHELMGNDFLFVVTTNSGSTNAILRKYDADYGSIVIETNLPVRPSANYTVYTNASSHPILVLHQADKIVTVDLYFDTIEINSYPKNSISGMLNNIVGVIPSRETENQYYILDSGGIVVRTDKNLSYIDYVSLAMNLYGVGLYNPTYYRLFVAGSAGVVNIDTSSTLNKLTDVVAREVKYCPFAVNILQQKVYIGFSKTSDPGIGQYDVANNLAENWFYRTFDPITYSALYYSDLLEVLAAVDDYGSINVIDSTTGTLLFNKYVGVITRPFLKWTKDYYGKTVFFAVNNPPRVFCFSLDYAKSGGI